MSDEGVRVQDTLQVFSQDAGLLRWTEPLPFPTPLKVDQTEFLESLRANGASFNLYNSDTGCRPIGCRSIHWVAILCFVSVLGFSNFFISRHKKIKTLSIVPRLRLPRSQVQFESPRTGALG